MKLNNKNLVVKNAITYSVPSGKRILIFPGQEIVLHQVTGYNFTLNIGGNLVLLDEKAATITHPTMQLPNKTFQYNTQYMNYILVWDQLQTIFDPEININIVDLGLVYKVLFTYIQKKYTLHIKLTLTSPTCGMGSIIVTTIKNRLKIINYFQAVIVDITFNPQWTYSMMSKDAQLLLGL